MIKLELPITLESSNKVWRMHWATRRKIKTHYMDEIMVYLLEHGLKDIQADGKRECRITSYRKRLLDRDRLQGGTVSMLIDALVDYGMLIDDNENVCDLKVGQKKSKNPRTVIALRDMEE